LRILDSEGNLVGYNYLTGLGENNIPTAIYSGPFSEPQYIVIINPELGTYKLELLGISEGQYDLAIQGNYGEDVTDIFEYEGEIKPAELHGSDLTVTAVVGPLDIYTNPPEFEETIDVTPPTTTLTIGEPKYVSDTTYVTPDTPFSLEATDIGSGVNSTAYRIYNATYDSGWIMYTGSFKLNSLKNGNYTLAFDSTDNAGNVEETNIVQLTLVRAYDCKGDVTGDGKCNIYDLVKIAAFYRRRSTDPDWNPIYDFVKDGVINIFDLVTCSQYYKT